MNDMDIEDKMSNAVRDAGICHCAAQRHSRLLEVQFCFMPCGLRVAAIEEEISKIEKYIIDSNNDITKI